MLALFFAFACGGLHKVDLLHDFLEVGCVELRLIGLDKGELRVYILLAGRQLLGQLHLGLEVFQLRDDLVAVVLYVSDLRYLCYDEFHDQVLEFGQPAIVVGRDVSQELPGIRNQVVHIDVVRAEVLDVFFFDGDNFCAELLDLGLESFLPLQLRAGHFLVQLANLIKQRLLLVLLLLLVVLFLDLLIRGLDISHLSFQPSSCFREPAALLQV